MRIDWGTWLWGRGVPNGCGNKPGGAPCLASAQVGESRLFHQDVCHPSCWVPSASSIPGGGCPAGAVSGPSRTLHSAYCLQVLVPCKGSLSSSIQSTCQFESYILIPVEEHFQTLNGKVFTSLWVSQGSSLSVWKSVGRAGGPTSFPVPAVINNGSDIAGGGGGLEGPLPLRKEEVVAEQGLAGPLPGRMGGEGWGGLGRSSSAQGPPAGKSGILWNSSWRSCL